MANLTTKDIQNKMILQTLKENTVIDINHRSRNEIVSAVFKKVSISKFVAELDGTPYNFPLAWFLRKSDDELKQAVVNTNKIGVKTFEQKKNELSRLKLGDIIKVRSNGIEEEVEFSVLKSKKFTAIQLSSGTPYIWPIDCFISFVRSGRAAEKVSNVLDRIEKNDLFYHVDSKGNCLLFKFIKFENGLVYGSNPTTKIVTRMDKQLVTGLVQDL